VGEAAREVAKTDPATFSYDPPTANRDGLVRLLKTPEDNDTRGRTQSYVPSSSPGRNLVG
jgi:hypothetical protein